MEISRSYIRIKECAGVDHRKHSEHDGGIEVPIFVGTLFAFTFALFSLPAAGNAKSCIESGDESAIVKALNSPDDEAVLCPYSEFKVAHTIELKSSGQKLYTQGRPHGDARAKLKISDRGISSAIFSRSSNIVISNVVIDGAREELGRDTHTDSALIEIGGDASNITVDHVRASNPRGWSVIHVFEGGDNCADARITNNDVGPAGHGDGDWADGISFACTHGLIENNTVTDASDGGIVVFGAPGTLVSRNRIRTTKNILLGGINLVDYKPYAGNYTGVVVSDNIIEARGGYIKVAIAAGPAVWGASGGLINSGAKIANNTIRGSHLGFGIAVDGVEDFIVTGNHSSAQYSGTPGKRCRSGIAKPGYPFVRNYSTTRGVFQTDFKHGVLDYVICYSEANP